MNAGIAPTAPARRAPKAAPRGLDQAHVETCFAELRHAQYCDAPGLGLGGMIGGGPLGDFRGIANGSSDPVKPSASRLAPGCNSTPLAPPGAGRPPAEEDDTEELLYGGGVLKDPSPDKARHEPGRSKIGPSRLETESLSHSSNNEERQQAMSNANRQIQPPADMTAPWSEPMQSQPLPRGPPPPPAGLRPAQLPSMHRPPPSQPPPPPGHVTGPAHVAASSSGANQATFTPAGQPMPAQAPPRLEYLVDKDGAMYCLLCNAYADAWHLQSKRHLKRAEHPEWYLWEEDGQSSSAWNSQAAGVQPPPPEPPLRLLRLVPSLRLPSPTIKPPSALHASVILDTPAPSIIGGVNGTGNKEKGCTWCSKPALERKVEGSKARYCEECWEWWLNQQSGSAAPASSRAPNGYPPPFTSAPGAAQPKYQPPPQPPPLSAYQSGPQHAKQPPWPPQPPAQSPAQVEWRPERFVQSKQLPVSMHPPGLEHPLDLDGPQGLARESEFSVAPESDRPEGLSETENWLRMSLDDQEICV